MDRFIVHAHSNLILVPNNNSLMYCCIHNHKMYVDVEPSTLERTYVCIYHVPYS